MYRNDWRMGVPRGYRTPRTEKMHRNFQKALAFVFRYGGGIRRG